jgi:hypothetical protein
MTDPNRNLSDLNNNLPDDDKQLEEQGNITQNLKNQEIILSLRVKPQFAHEIDQISRKLKVNKSDFIRKAISDSISIHEIYRKNQTFLIGPNMFEFSLKFMDECDLEEYAQLALENGKRILKLYLQKQINTSIVQKYLKNKKTILTGLLFFITESILSPVGQELFKRIFFSWKENQVILTGVHHLGDKFSIFMRFYFIHFFKLFQFTEVKDECLLKENKIKLVFEGDIGKYDISFLMN